MNRPVLLWIVWLALVVSVTWTGFLWEVEYFRSPGPLFFRLLLLLLFLSPLIVAAYQRLRRAWFEWEPLIATLPVIAGLVYEPRSTLVAMAIVLAALAVGGQLRALLGLRPQGPVEEIVVAAALGFGALNCALFLFGLAGLYLAGALAALFIAALLLGARQLPGVWAAMIAAKNGWTEEADFRSLPGALLVLFGLALMITATMVILAPSVAFDVIAMHLPLVHYYASKHVLRTPSYLHYGYFPQSVEVLMTAGYVLGGDSAAQMLPPVYFALALMTAYRIGRLCGLDRFSSFTGVVFAAAIPFLHWTGSVAKNDLALAFFTLATLLGYLRWRKSQDFRWILAAAFFLAMAAGVKHIVVFAMPPLLLLFLHATLRQRAPFRSAALLSVVFVVFGLFWHVRTWLLTGNPLYPQVASVATSGYVGHQGSVWQRVILPYVRFPWELFFRGRLYFESPLEQPLGILLLLFVPLWFVARKRIAAAEWVCLLFCGLYLAYWTVTVGMVRFAIAPFILLSVLTASRVIAFWRTPPKAGGISIVIALAYGLLFGFFGVAIQEVNAPQLRYFTFRIDKTGYLREALTPYRALEFVRQASRPGESAFGVDACAVAYVREPAAFDCVLQINSAPAQIQARIERKDYRFVILPRNHPELAPAGWSNAYSDASYDVLKRSNANPRR